jgi:hypothetical protein
LLSEAANRRAIAQRRCYLVYFGRRLEAEV